jgi:hypothetical protein
VRDELSLNRPLSLVPAEAGTQFFGRVLSPWIPAFAGMSGDRINGGADLNPSHSSARQIANGGIQY